MKIQEHPHVALPGEREKLPFPSEIYLELSRWQRLALPRKDFARALSHGEKTFLPILSYPSKEQTGSTMPRASSRSGCCG